MGKVFKGCLMLVGGVVVLIVVVAIIAAAAGGSHSSSGGSSGPSNSNSSGNSGGSSGGDAAGTVYVDHSGSGQWNSTNFTVKNSDWQIDYSYDCSNFGSKGNFQVSLGGNDWQLNSAGVNELKKQGSGTTSVHDGSGTGYIQVNSECDWHIKAHS